MSAYANGLGLLMLTISANFTGDLFGCGFRRALENPMAKHAVAFLLLLFFVVFTSKDQYLKPGTNEIVTLDLLKNTAFIYAAFIVISKTEFSITLPILAILGFIMLMNLEKENKNHETQEKIQKYMNIAIYAGVILAVIGFVSYYNRQRQDHANNFDMYKFLLGSTKCSS